ILHGHAFRCHVAIEAKSNVDEYFAHDSPVAYSDVCLTYRSAARGEQREPVVRCSVKFDAGLILAAAMIQAYCMISSARSSTDCGMVSLGPFAVFILTGGPLWVGCATGSSAGLVPLRI